MVLAGAATVRVPHTRGYVAERGNVHSLDGRCRPFDANGQGAIFGSGVAAVLLKRLDDALADGDHIHAVIKGTSVTNDGASKPTYTAPSVTGQARAMTDALARADVAAGHRRLRRMPRGRDRSRRSPGDPGAHARLRRRDRAAQGRAPWARSRGTSVTPSRPPASRHSSRRRSRWSTARFRPASTSSHRIRISISPAARSSSTRRSATGRRTVIPGAPA